MYTLWSPLLGGSDASAAVAASPMMGVPKLLREAARWKAALARSSAVSALQYWAGSCRGQQQQQRQEQRSLW